MAVVQDAVRHAIAGVGMVGDAHVVQHRQVREQADVLERPGDPQLVDLMRFQSGDFLPIEHDPAGGRHIHAGDHVKDGSFPGAVGADQAVQIAGIKGFTEVVDRT